MSALLCTFQQMSNRSTRWTSMPKSTKLVHGSPEPRCSCSPGVENWTLIHLLILSHTLVYGKHLLGELPSQCLGYFGSECLWNWLLRHRFLSLHPHPSTPPYLWVFVFFFLQRATWWMSSSLLSPSLPTHGFKHLGFLPFLLLFFLFSYFL